MAEDYLDEELKLRDEKLGGIIKDLTPLIDKKIINTAKKIKEIT